MTSESIFDILRRNIEHANLLVSQLESLENFSTTGIYQFNPIEGNVVFASGLHGWAFTLREFSELYASRFGISAEKFADRMWGEHYFDTRRKIWVEEEFDDQGNPLETGFLSFILQPLKTLYSAVYAKDIEKVNLLSGRLGINLPPHLLTQMPKQIIKACMNQWMPITKCLTRIIKHIMPPSTAAFSARYLDTVERSNSRLAKSIKNADGQGDLLAILVKRWSTEAIPVWVVKVLSGTVSIGKKIFLSEGDKLQHGLDKIIFKPTLITEIFSLTGDTKFPVPSISAGSIGGITFSTDLCLKGGILSCKPLPELNMTLNLSTSHRKIE